ncbi:hypothetical protein K501DRAFT_269303 [Backusella circina FSU 941]|nr:hypothetical protein K501DRAFT_269303 [Backusella circina FSU 941]
MEILSFATSSVLIDILEVLASLSKNHLPPGKSKVSCIRQLPSSFDHILIYKPWRATLDDFDDTRFMPTTVFTLCDTPDSDGYGSINKSCTKLDSLLLKKVAIALNVKADLDKNGDQEINVSFFITEVTLSKLASLVGSLLSKANEKIANNVKERFLGLYN